MNYDRMMNILYILYEYIIKYEKVYIYDFCL